MPKPKDMTPPIDRMVITSETNPAYIEAAIFRSVNTNRPMMVESQGQQVGVFVPMALWKTMTGDGQP